jgi:hypothetical protein
MQFTPINFKDIDPVLQQWYIQQITLLNNLIAEFNLTKEKTPNSLSAIKRCIAFLLLRPATIDFVSEGNQNFFLTPKNIYDGQYLAGCFYDHAQFLFTLDEERFDHQFLVLMDIAHQKISFLLQAQTSSQLPILKTELDRISKIAKEKNWNGKISVVSAYMSY